MKKLIFLLYYTVVCLTLEAQKKNEYLKINWPEEYKWKVVLNEEDTVKKSISMIPGYESTEKWTIMAHMLTMKNHNKADKIGKVIEVFTQAALKASPKAICVVLEKMQKAKNAWTIFKIETPEFPNDPMPESQLYYAIQGNSTLYINFVAIKEKNLSKAFVDKWSKIFKRSALLYK